MLIHTNIEGFLPECTLPAFSSHIEFEFGPLRQFTPQQVIKPKTKNLERKVHSNASS